MVVSQCTGEIPKLFLTGRSMMPCDIIRNVANTQVSPEGMAQGNELLLVVSPDDRLHHQSVHALNR